MVLWGIMNIILTISVLLKYRVGEGEDWSDLGTEASLVVERFAAH